MADAAVDRAARGRGRRSLALLFALLVPFTAREGRAAEADTLAGAAAAFVAGGAVEADSTPLGALAANSGSSMAGAGPATPFTIRRVNNPRYRPPGAGVPGIGPTAQSRLRALDHFRAQVHHQTLTIPGGFTLWEVAGGELYRDDDAVEIAVAGARRAGRSELHALRLSGRMGAMEGSAMDVAPVLIGRSVYLHRLRGAVLRLTDPREGRWLALGGVPTPLPGSATPRLALGGAAFENVRFDEAELSGSLFGFWRGEPRAAATPTADSLPGRGAAGALGWRAPAAGGTLSGRLGAQLHSLEGRRALAAQHAVEWSFQSPQWVASLSDERGTRRLRLLGTDRFAAAPRREDRWNLQHRFARGRAETHLTGVVRDGGDPTLATRTFQLGASGAFGRSAWYGGGDAVWDRRAIAAIQERRFSIYGGGLLERGHALLARLEYAVRDADREVLTAMGEASLALPRGARLGLEPRLGWADGVFRQGDFATRLSWPLGWLSTRITGGLTVGTVREDGFRGTLREASLAIALAPRLRDRADFEVRRIDQNGRPTMEVDASYDAVLPRYETPGQGWFAGRDTGRVTVRVVRSGNGSGVADILISLDGQSLRFTDADGVARFDRVAPGIHVVAIEERSLPANYEVAQASRVFVTVERGRAPDPVRFVVGRGERRTKF